jgi:hypothetical protein
LFSIIAIAELMPLLHHIFAIVYFFRRYATPPYAFRC